MRTVNTVTLLGNVVRPPERRITTGGKPFVTFMLATQRETQKYGENKSIESEFHTVVAWGGLAGIAGNFCKKGALVYIEGSLKTRSWENGGGLKMFKTEIITNTIISLKSPRQKYEKNSENSSRLKIPDEEFFTATYDDFEK